MLPFLTQPAAAPACYVPNYQPDGSQLFDGDAYLARTPGAAGNRQLFTIAGWFWLNGPGDGSENHIWGSWNTGDWNQFEHFEINSDQLMFRSYIGGTVWDVRYAYLRGLGLAHIMAVYDSNNAVANDRIRLYLNGERMTPTTNTQPALGAQTSFFNTTTPQWIGRRAANAQNNYYKGGMADVVFVDGQALDPSVFGEFNIHGVWVPKVPELVTADFGINGFWLDFANPLSPGLDVSGKGNNFTASGFDGTGKDRVASTPTNVYCALNSLWEYSGIISGGGLVCEATASKGIGGLGTIGFRSDEKVYFEIEVQAYAVGNGSSLYPGIREFNGAYYSIFDNAYIGWRGRKYSPAGAEAYSGNPVNPGDIISVVYNAGELRFWINGVDQGIAFSGLTTATRFYPWLDGNNYAGNRFRGNFGQRPFAYTPPAGFKTLCTDNIPEPEVKDPAEGYVAEAGTGANIMALLDAATAHWNGAAYVEIVKRRDGAEDWRVRFSDDPANAWATNNANAKAAAPALTAGGSYEGWRLRVGNLFGVWTGEVEHVTGTPTTVTHGLATARNVVIATRVSAGGGDRFFRHPDMVAGELLKLNTIATAAADTTITSFGANSCQIGAAASSGTYRVVVLAERAGYLCLSKHTGNGQSGSNGAFCPLDLSPDFLLIGKRAVGSGSWNWQVRDTLRAKGNPDSSELRMNSSSAEITSSPETIDKVVGGYKTLSANGSTNESGQTYYTVAIGRPIGGVCVAPATAR